MFKRHFGTFPECLFYFRAKGKKLSFSVFHRLIFQFRRYYCFFILHSLTITQHWKLKINLFPK